MEIRALTRGGEGIWLPKVYIHAKDDREDPAFGLYPFPGEEIWDYSLDRWHCVLTWSLWMSYR